MWVHRPCRSWCGSTVAGSPPARRTSVVAETLGLRSTAGDLTGVPPQALANATGGIEYQDRWGYPLAVRRSQFGPVIDGEILPDSPFRTLAAGAARGVDLLIGHNRDEYRYVVHENGGVVTAEQAERALDLLPPTPGGAQTYRAAYPRANHAELYELVCSDFVYRMPTLHIAQAHALGGGATHLYEFCSDASSFGAAHTTEIPLVFGTLDSPIGSALYGSAPQAEAVSREMSAAWRAFDRRRSRLAGVRAHRAVHAGVRHRLQDGPISRAGVTTDLERLSVRPVRPVDLARPRHGTLSHSSSATSAAHW